MSELLRLEKIKGLAIDMRQQGLKKKKMFKSKRFKTAKAYWEGFAQASACMQTIIEGYIIPWLGGGTYRINDYSRAEMNKLCKRGHPLTVTTTVTRLTDMGNVVRECKQCRNYRRRLYRKGLRVKGLKK